jgi:hypothetical protein
MGVARRAQVLAQANGVEANLGGVAGTAAIRTGATQIAQSVVIALGDVDGGEVA